MKLKRSAVVAIAGLSLFCQVSFAAGATLTYKNTRGSLLKLQFGENNALGGTFTTAVASKECQQAIGQERPIVGFIAKNAIAFSVSYPDCGSVVTFTGNIENDKQIIDATAIVAHASAHIATEGPGARMIGHDVFNQL